jgi:hypothetical protein
MGRVESLIQSDILRYLRGLDKTYVVNMGGSASAPKGTPDILVCHRGRFVAFEVKRPDGSYGLTTPQRIRLKQIELAEGTGAVVTSVMDVIAVLAKIER